MSEESLVDTEQLKKCSKCGEEKALTAFHKKKGAKDGRNGKCKLCIKAYMAHPDRVAAKKAYTKKYRSRPEVRAAEKIYSATRGADPKVKAAKAAYAKKYVADPKNKAAKLAYDRDYVADPNNKAIRAAYMKDYTSEPENKAAKKEYMKAYRLRPEVRIREQETHKRRMANDPAYRMRKQLMSLAHHARRYINNGADLKSSRDYGCTSEELVLHMAKTWFDRYGTIYDPNIHTAVWDHILPLSRIKTWTPEIIEMMHCWNNFQLLTSEMNGEKGNKLMYMEFASDEVKEYIKSNNLV